MTTQSGTSSEPAPAESGWWILLKVLAFIIVPAGIVYVVKLLVP
jgi:hypothetical protein